MLISHDEMTAQRTFRCLLESMSRPGRLCTLPFSPADVQAPWAALLLVLESLLDQEVTFAVIGGNGSGDLEERIAERTRCSVAAVGLADYIIAAADCGSGEILQAKRGSLQYPDTSATIIFPVQAIPSQESRPPVIALAGPGIRGEILLGPIKGFDFRQIEYLKGLNSEFPLGVDTILVDGGGRILSIPRSTNLRIRES